ncbi:hypothetical protein GCM10014715_08850 [Streptomyces spiralis]|uniref:Integral membrane protein n=1 Tax=Streptomyces spiralis TaxID=66376 RepID=A0A918ZKK2_9ACTN|nr:hypothetical protein [Streptomyces spiralis]GHE58141.1 hypothetical protein GCM10014715_08850 [Streptomyces spiralis]
MLRHPVPPRSPGFSGRAVVILAAFAAVLLAAVFLAPQSMAANHSSEDGFVHQRNLIRAANEAFVGYWDSGDRAFTPDMQRVVDYWFRFHAIKAGISIVLLIVLVALSHQAWKAYVGAGGSGRGRRAGLASAGALALILTTLALLLVVANVQGAVAPFTSVLTLMPVGASHGQLAGTLAQVRERLTDSQNTGDRTPPAIDVMISDFALYHEVVVVMSVILAIIFIGLSVVLWKRFARTGPSARRTRSTLGWFGASSTVFSLFAIILFMANLSNTVNPTEGLLGFFAGSF